jgi:signal transduction histidine kinase
LQQIILNLLMNAIEAIASADSTNREVLLKSSRLGAQNIQVAVCDSGPGLGHLSFEQISETFFTTKPSGMGMGLAISRSIIEVHGGSMWAEPNPGRGATFFFSLPIADNAAQVSQTPS